jgi:uncharacterized protein
MRRMEKRTGIKIEIDDRLAVRMHALVHDLTHIAFGHTLEDELNIFTRHDKNEKRIDSLFLSKKSELGKALNGTEHGRFILKYLKANDTAKKLWIHDLIDSPFGADVLDYIDRDSYYCGLDHKVDSAIFRRISLSERGATDVDQRKLRADLYGHKGFRIDAEYALVSLLYERLAIYMKVYTHPVKISSGAMIGKALWEAKLTKNHRLSERNIEWMGDNELLLRINGVGKVGVSYLVDGIISRHLYKPAYQAKALDPRAYKETLSLYQVRQNQFKDKGLLDPFLRGEHERMIAKKCGMKAHEVIIYCSEKAPGPRKVRHYISSQPGHEEKLDEVYAPYLRVASGHVALWVVYVFVPPTTTLKKKRQVASVAQELIGLPNEVNFDHRSLRLTF